jgi:hypothetical protein
MIEIEVQFGGERRIFVILASTIARYTAAGAGATSVTLTDGTELLALVPYPTFRGAVNTVCNQFISLVPATTA